MPLELESLCQETGLRWPTLPTYEDWAELGPRLASVQNVSRWALADWLCTGEDLFQDRADQVISSLGLAYHTLENLRWVARRVGPSLRRPLPVSFSHHALVATLAPSVQDTLLGHCQAMRWTRDEFRDYLVAQGTLPSGGCARREEWRLQAGAVVEARLNAWYETSDLCLGDIIDRRIWSRERETLVADLLKIVERFRR